MPNDVFDWADRRQAQLLQGRNTLFQEHDPFACVLEEAKKVFLTHAARMSASLELADWSESLITDGKEALHLIVQVGAFICEECAEGAYKDMGHASLAKQLEARTGSRLSSMSYMAPTSLCSWELLS